MSTIYRFKSQGITLKTYKEVLVQLLNEFNKTILNDKLELKIESFKNGNSRWVIRVYINSNIYGEIQGLTFFSGITTEGICEKIILIQKVDSFKDRYELFKKGDLTNGLRINS